MYIYMSILKLRKEERMQCVHGGARKSNGGWVKMEWFVFFDADGLEKLQRRWVSKVINFINQRLMEFSINFCIYIHRYNNKK